MRHTLLLLAGLLMGFAPAPLPKPPPSEASQRDLQAMQGEWAERFADSATVTITGDRMVYTSDSGWKFTLNAERNPKRIEATGFGPSLTGKTRVGIYRVEKDQLTICWRRGPTGKVEWPASLSPIQKDVWVEVFTRVKP